MPSAPLRRTPVYGWLLLAAILLFIGYGSYKHPLLVLLVAFLFWRANAKFVRHMNLLSQQRAGEDICTFVRSFDCRKTDTWILRAVYEEMSKYCQVKNRFIPIRPEDRWKEDLKIDAEDLGMDLLPDIADRSGRSLKNTNLNPYYSKVKTVQDLVNFLEHQPKL
jgi:hypothetical protein